MLPKTFDPSIGSCKILYHQVEQNVNQLDGDERKTKVHPEIRVLLKHLLDNDLIVPCPCALPDDVDDVDDNPTYLLLYMLTSISLDDQVELHYALKIKTIDMYAKVLEYQIRFAVNYSKRSLLRYFDNVTASDEPIIPWSSMPLQSLMMKLLWHTRNKMIIIFGKQDYSSWCTYTTKTPNGRQCMLKRTMVHLIQHTKLKVAQAIRPAIQINPGSELDKSSTASDAELDDIDREIHTVMKELSGKEELYDADADSSSYYLINPLFISSILFQHFYLTYSLMVMMGKPGSENGSFEHEPTPCMADTLVDLNTPVDPGGPERIICRISRRLD